MRKISLVLISLLIITACDLMKQDKIVVLNDRLTSATTSGADENAPSISKPLNEAMVKGTVQNVTDKPLKDIVITYKMARGKVTAKIALLKPNQKSTFTTTKYQTKQNTPKYELESITFKE